jgi:diaminopimelate epimerase
MHFTKMQGCGNDYVYVDCFAQKPPGHPAALGQKIADRHFGVGGDGLILICPSEKADARMRMFNADGSEAEMCGNGVRCVAKYVYDHGIARKPTLTIETGRGILEAAKIPTTLRGHPPIDVPLPGYDFKATCVSMGNPHCVIFVEAITDQHIHGIGPQIEKDAIFPRKTNVEFVKVNRPDDVTFRVWERGSGETQACGTGACAVAVAGVLTGRTEREITAHLLGGDLQLLWSEKDNHVYMTGPAVEVFSGEWPD